MRNADCGIEEKIRKHALHSSIPHSAFRIPHSETWPGNAYYLRNSAINSERVEGLCRKMPRMALVVHRVPGLCIPRIVIQVCSASTTT